LQQKKEKGLNIILAVGRERVSCQTELKQGVHISSRLSWQQSNRENTVFTLFMTEDFLTA
jgi:hypothetical protein